MQSRALLASFVLLLSACAPRTLAPVPVPVAAAPASTEVQILAINDFHGNLEPPKFGIDATAPDGSKVRVPAGGVAHLATAAKTLRQGQPNTITVAAGDLIGATPLVSALYLDEPAIDALDSAANVEVRVRRIGLRRRRARHAEKLFICHARVLMRRAVAAATCSET